ncbi:MAG: hypothetical protein ACREC9_14495 [Methylocella sp.]
MPAIAASHAEKSTFAWRGALGFAVKSGPDIGPDGAAAERRAHGEVVLAVRELRSPS